MGPLAYYMADDFFIPNPPLNTSRNITSNEVVIDEIVHLSAILI